MATRSDYLKKLADQSGLRLEYFGDQQQGKSGRSARVLDPSGAVVTTLNPSRTESAYNRFAALLEQEDRGIVTPLSGYGNIAAKSAMEKPLSLSEHKQQIYGDQSSGSQQNNSTSAVSIDYTKHANESIAEYKARIAQARSKQSGDASTTQPSTGGTQERFVKFDTNAGPAFFERTQNGLQAISDPNIINQLKSGALSYGTQDSLGSSKVSQNVSPTTLDEVRKTGTQIPRFNDSALNNPVIKNSELTSNSTNDDVVTRVKNILDDLTKAQKKVLESMVPTQEETDIQNKLLDVQNEARQINQHQQELNNQSEGRLASLRSVRGEQAGVQREANDQLRALEIRRQALAEQLGVLVQQRQTRIDALTTQMQFSKTNLELLQTLQDLTQPDSISTFTDKETGIIYSLDRDPQTGEVTQNVVGSVPKDKAQNFDYKGSVVLNDGTKAAWGFDSEGNIVTQAIPRSIAGVSQLNTGSSSSSVTNPGNYTPQELRKLRQAGIDPMNIATADDYLYGQGNPDSPSNIKEFTDQFVATIKSYKDDWGFSKSDAKKEAERQIRAQLKLGKDDSIPSVYQNVINDALSTVYSSSSSSKLPWWKDPIGALGF